MSTVIPKLGTEIVKGILKSVDSNALVSLTEQRTILPSDLMDLIKYNSAADGNFIVPDDATLGIEADDAVFIEVYQAGTGVPTFTAGAGVTVNVWSGYPTSSQYVTQTLIHVGANEWAVK